MATKKTTPTGAVKVRILRDCPFGKADQVVELTGEDLANAISHGMADADPAAVAYAETLGA